MARMKSLFLVVMDHLLLVFSLCLCACPVAMLIVTEVTLGVLMPLRRWSNLLGYNQSRLAISLAEERARQDGLLANYRIRWEYADDQASLAGGAGGAVRLKSRNAHVLMGSPLEVACYTAALYAASWNLPHLTWAPGSFDLSDKERFSTLFFTGCPYKAMARAVTGFMTLLNYTSIAILVRDESSDYTSRRRCKDIIRGLEVVRNESETLTLESVEIYNSERNFSEELVFQFFQRRKPKTKVFLLCGLLAEERKIMTIARKLRMTKGNYVFLIPHLLQEDVNYWQEDDVDSVGDAFKAVLQIKPNFGEVTTNSMRGVFLKRFRDERLQMTVTAPLLHDTALLYFHYLNSTPTLITNGTLLRRFLSKLSFQGVTGDVTMDSDGDRIPSFLVWGLQEGTYRPGMKINIHPLKTLERIRKPWSLNDGNLPKESLLDIEPEPNNVTIALFTGITSFLMFIVFSVVLTSFMRHRKAEVTVGRMTWMVNQSDIVVTNAFESRSSLTSSLSLPQERVSRRSLGILWETTAMKSLNIGRCKGIPVVIEPLNIGTESLSKQTLAQLNELRQMAHDNINRFVGAAIRTPVMFLLYTYLPEGCLQNVLLNHDVSLNWYFKMSLIDDLTQGLHFLHTQTSVKSHGRLKSTNCIMDSRWVLKITDHGIPALRRFRRRHSVDPNKAMLWTAPELLRMTHKSRPPHGSMKGDIYSYGLILHEIVFRKGVFSWLDIKSKYLKDYFAETIAKLYKGRDLTHTVHRPYIHRNTDETICEQAFRELTKLMKTCWQEASEERPDTKYLKNYLCNMSGERKNVVDDRLQRADEFSKRLEKAVEDRTGNLREAKEKTDKLLYRMLPKEVAEDLKAGVQVHPESYESVTIFNSDIVGFTVISSKSTPQEIVNMLTEVTVLLDDIMDSYNVYKVETIGDSYMVASGLPTRNDRHVKEICDMSLDFVNALKGYHMSHLPQHPFQVRIGVHTGPVVAGVVGMKLPRYCLFGDTVIVATRMESYGEGLKIHLSEAADGAIHKFPGYFTEKRGVIDVKGIGPMKTFWLNRGPPKTRRKGKRSSTDSNRRRKSSDVR